jgi:hypothetical protein
VTRRTASSAARMEMNLHEAAIDLRPGIATATIANEWT